MNFSNQIHPGPDTLIGNINLWLSRNYDYYFNDDGTIDTGAIAGAVIIEFDCEEWLADDLAALLAAEFDKGV